MKLIMILGITLTATACSGGEQRLPSGNNLKIKEPKAHAEKQSLASRLADIHEEWMGTAWAFSGTSQTPRKGAIACGYFVTTTLKQAGVKLDRVRLAQAASETMILALTDQKSIRRYRNVSLDSFLNGIRSQGQGYYIVGLDYHTGFLKVESNGSITFVHSGPGRGVVKQKPSEAPELSKSRYRVTGKIIEKSMIEQSATKD